jgi:uncharacterized protein (TIGR03083 family)
VSAALDALQASVEGLAGLGSGFTDADLVAPAYPAEWTVADVLSHLGSGSVIWQRRLDDALAGRATPDDLQQAVWSEWDAKAPRAKADDGIAADRRLFDRLASLTDEERSTVRVSMGPMEFGFDQLVGMRLNEHVLHTWDVEVVGDPAAVLPPGAAEQVIDNVALIARYTARPTGASRAIVVRTTRPARVFTITLGPDRVGFAATAAAGDDPPDAELPAEAFVRLVYGRLDPRHTPPVSGEATIAQLRRVFPGP